MSALVWYNWIDWTYGKNWHILARYISPSTDVWFIGHMLSPFLFSPPFPLLFSCPLVPHPKQKRLTPRTSLTTRRVMLSEWVNGVKLSTLPKEVPRTAAGQGPGGVKGVFFVGDGYCSWWLFGGCCPTDFLVENTKKRSGCLFFWNRIKDGYFRLG